MKKYLLFLPTALYFYLFYGISQLIDSSSYFPTGSTFLDILPYLVLTLLTAITYLIGLVTLLTSREHTAKSAVIAALLVKIPQLVPLGLLLGGSMVLLCLPLGILGSIVIWCIIGFVYSATSIAEAIACFKMWRAGQLSLPLAILLGVCSFIFVLDYMALLVILIKLFAKQPQASL